MSHPLYLARLLENGVNGHCPFRLQQTPWQILLELFKLPAKNYPYCLIGDKTKDSLNARSAAIDATWGRTTNKITLSANKTAQNLTVTGLSGGELYGGQLIKTFNLGAQPVTFTINRALAQWHLSCFGNFYSQYESYDDVLIKTEDSWFWCQQCLNDWWQSVLAWNYRSCGQVLLAVCYRQLLGK